MARGLSLRWGLAIFVAALVLRGGWGAFREVRADDRAALEFPDEQQYWLMATSLRNGDGLLDELGFRATRMPLYPAALSLLPRSSGGILIAKSAQWLIGALSAVFAAGTATLLFGRREGMLAGLLVTLDPFLIFFSSLLLTETLAVTLLAALWWVLASGLRADTRSLSRWALAGLLGALSVYTRESLLGLVFVAFGFMVMAHRFDRRALAGACVACGIVLAALVPWAVRNRGAVGEWCWLTTRAGISLYDGVGPGATGASDLGDIKQMPAVRGLGEAEWNRYFLNESWKAVKSDPARIVGLAGTKLARMWNPFPNVEAYQSRLARFASAAWTIPTFACAILGVLILLAGTRRDGVRTGLLLLLPAIYLSALHGLFVGSVRYRLAAVPMLEILAALALVAVADWRRAGHAGREDLNER
jgi:hypothetical protein